MHEVIGQLITGDGPACRDRLSGIGTGELEIAPFDPATPMGGRDFNTFDLDVLLDELRAERAQSSTYVRSLQPADLERTLNYVAQAEQDRAFAAVDFANEWPFRDQNHLQQILANMRDVHAATMRFALDVD